MKKAKKLTPNQEAWKKEVKRIKAAVRRAEKQGYELYNPDEFYKMLEMPNRVTANRLHELRRSTWRDNIYNHLIVLDRDTGEFWTGRTELKRRREQKRNERRAKKELERQRKIGEEKRKELEEEKQREKEKAIDDVVNKIKEGILFAGQPKPVIDNSPQNGGYLAFLVFYEEFYNQVNDFSSIYDDIYRNPYSQQMSIDYAEDTSDLLEKEIDKLMGEGYSEKEAQTIIGERLSSSGYAMEHLNTMMYDSNATEIQTAYQVLSRVIVGRNLTFEELIKVNEAEATAEGVNEL